MALGGGEVPAGPLAGPGVCLAIRGDDGHIFAQTAALASLIDRTGLPGAVAGRRSATVTMRLLDAMLANPAVRICGGEPCSTADVGDRVALLLRSLEGYVAHVGEGAGTLPLVGTDWLVERATAEQVDKDLAAGRTSGRAALVRVLEAPDVLDIASEPTRQWLAASPTPVTDAQSVLSSLRLGLAGVLADGERPAISRAAFDLQVSRIAAFYAGRADPAAFGEWRAFLDECAAKARATPWLELAGLPAGVDTCGRSFRRLLGHAEAAAPASPDAAAWTGKSLPLLTATPDEDHDSGLVRGLYDLGCESVLYLTRRSAKAAPRAAVPGAKVVAADLVWCTDWGSYRERQILDLAQDLEDSPLLVAPGRAPPLGFSTFPGLTPAGSAPSIPGCNAP